MTTRFTPTRRSVLGALGAFGVAASAMPRMAISQDGKVLTVRSYSDLQVLDPAFWVSLPEGDIITAIFPPLVAPIAGDEWGWKPVAAKSIEQVDDLTIEFELHDDLVTTGGFGKLTAEDVKFSLERIADPANESPYLGDWSALDEVEVTGELTGRIKLKEKFVPLWTTTMPTPSSAIVSKAAFESVGGRITTEPVGMAGQYHLVEWEPKQRTVLRRNPDWPGEPGGFEEIHIVPIEDPATAELGFEAGDLDYTWTAVSSLPRLREDPPEGATVLEKPSLAYVWLGMNAQVAPFDDPRVRRAVQHAIDRELVVDAAYYGAADVANGLVAPGLPGSREDVRYGYDPDRARELLAEAGAEGITITLDILNQSERLLAAQVIQANLADVGITVEINQQDSGTFWSLGAPDSPDYDRMQMYLQRFSMNPDPSWATVWFTPEQIGVWNWSRFEDDHFLALHQQGLTEDDPEARDAIYREMQELMDESGLFVFLTHEVVGVMHSDDIVPALKPNGDPLLAEFRPAT